MTTFMQDHMDAQQLLPWLANGTLADPERTRVQAHLEACAECRAELSLLHTLRGAGEGGVPGCDVDGALARLMPQLDAPAVLPAPSATGNPATVPRTWRNRLAANDRHWLRTGVALQFCVIVALGILLAKSPAAPESRSGDYRVLAATPAARTGLVVSFTPDTPERELRRILHASGARVVGGPTATGVWLLETEAAPASVLTRLRAEPAVTLAESLGEGRP